MSGTAPAEIVSFPKVPKELQLWFILEFTESVIVIDFPDSRPVSRGVSKLRSPVPVVAELIEFCMFADLFTKYIAPKRIIAPTITAKTHEKEMSRNPFLFCIN